MVCTLVPNFTQRSVRFPRAAVRHRSSVSLLPLSGVSGGAYLFTQPTLDGPGSCWELCLLWMKLLWILANWDFYEHMFPSLLGKYLRAEMQERLISMWLTAQETQFLNQVAAYHTTMCMRSGYCTFSATLGMARHLDSSHSAQGEVAPHCGFIHIFLVT